jgi:membrane fusion protein
MKLFRDEVVRSRRKQHLGTIQVARIPGARWALAASCTAGVALLAYAVLGELTRWTTAAGFLVPAGGAAQLSAPHPGVITHVHVREGDRVEVGQALVRVNTDRPTSRGDASELVARDLRQRRTAISEERASVQAHHTKQQQELSDRLRALQAEAGHAESEIALLRRREALALKSLERLRDLVGRGFVSEAQLQQKEEDLLDVAGRLAAAERSLGGVRREAATVAAQQLSLVDSLRTQFAQLDREAARARQEESENTARSEFVVAAPISGAVSALHAHVGLQAQPGQTLASILPASASQRETSLEAHLFAASRAIGFIRPGQRVLLRYAAYPHQRFGMGHGEVARVSTTPIAPQDLPPGQAQALLLAARTNEPLYRIVVRLASDRMDAYGVNQPLVAGMALEAEVIQDRRAVWQWALDPLLAVSRFGPSAVGTVPTPLGLSPSQP